MASFLAGASLEAGARLEVAGGARVEAARLIVELRLINGGDGPAVEPQVRAELGGQEQAFRADADLAAGATLERALSWPVPREGIHVLRLRLAYRDEADGTELQQPAWLLVPVGDALAPAIDVRLPDEVRLVHHAPLEVRLASLDGRAHEVRVDAVAPDGLRVLDPPRRVAVPAEGERVLHLTLLRSSAPVGSLQGLALAVETLDTGVVGSAVAPTRIRIVAPTRWTERLRGPALVAALLLLLAGSVAEWRRARAG